MGYARARDMIEMAGIEVALRDHLAHNLYPPVHGSFFPVALAAIRAVESGEDVAVLGNVVTVEQGESIVRALCLDAFVETGWAA